MERLPATITATLSISLLQKQRTVRTLSLAKIPLFLPLQRPHSICERLHSQRDRIRDDEYEMEILYRQASS